MPECDVVVVFAASCRDDDILLTLHDSRAVARWNNISLVAGETRFLGTRRRGYLLELPPSPVPLTSPAPYAIPLSSFLVLAPVSVQRQALRKTCFSAAE
jgi:hypothetical protein